ncbi:MAG: hypothetical protein GY803_31800 [Chloroflexi bacterium]|nr:hypothetical protein [Chloroflexota bacterium]
MAYTLKITGWEGGDLNLNDGVNYFLVNFTPAVSMLSEDGGGYKPVSQPLRVGIRGGTKAAALTNLHNLTAAINQAQRWSQGENVNAVLLEYDPDASGNPVKAAILGPSGDGWMNLPTTFRPFLEGFVIGPVRLDVWRRGAWLGDEDSATDTETSHPAIQVATFSTSHDLPSPVSFDNYTITSSGIGLPRFSAYLWVAENENYLHIIEAESLTGTGSSTPDSGSSGGNLERFTASGSIGYAYAAISLSALPNKYEHLRRVAVYAAVRNNTSSWWRLRASARSSSNVPDYLDVTPWRTIDNHMNAQLIRLGTLSISPVNDYGYTLTVHLDSENASSDTFDIDFLILMSVNEGAYFTEITGIGDGFWGASTHDIEILHQALTRPEPTIGAGSTDTRVVAGYSGPIQYWLRGNECATILYRKPFSDFIGASTPITSLSFTAKRNKAYLVPQ